jgi:hypothetical protein
MITGMRSDLPRPPEQADEPPPARSRERLAELRGRLERLPPGHPSSPGYPLPPGAPGDEQQASEPAGCSPDPISPDAGREPGSAGGQPPDDAQPELRRGAEPGRRAAAPGPGAYPGPWGSPEPYRPWFSGADWAAPWFTAVF